MSFRIPALALGACFAVSSAAADVTISNHATMHMSCSAGVCTPTAATAILNAGDLQTMLASSSVTVKSSAVAPNIAVTGAVTWASANTLTLDSYRSVSVGKQVSVAGTSGLAIVTNDGGAGGALSFPAMGRVIFWDLGSSLTINGHGYTLVGDIATLAGDVAANASGYYALANDYDAGVDGAYSETPVATSLDGAFEGLGNTISRLKILGHGRHGGVGLFAQLDASGMISDLRLAKLFIRGPSRARQPVMGGVVGVSYGLLSGDSVGGTINAGPAAAAAGGIVGDQFAGTITGAYSNATITADGDATIGGVAGAASGLVTDSHGAGTITGAQTQGEAGGLVGALGDGGSVTNSDAAGTVSGGGWSGGLAGGLGSGGAITGSHASTSVSNAYDWGGGLVGYNAGTISTSYATGAVLNASGAGGLVGVNAETGTIDQCFALGAVSGVSEGGGLAGNNVGTITNTCATGSVSGGSFAGGLVGIASNAGESLATSYATGNVSGSGFVGGLIGKDAQPGSTSSAYWDIDGSITNPSQGAGTPANDPGITGLATAQFQSGLPSGFGNPTWGSNPGINGGLPYLPAVPPQ